MARKQVILTKPLPSWQELERKTKAYKNQASVTDSEMVAHARHEYTNYDTLCRQLARRTKGFQNKQIAADYKLQANQLIGQWYRQKAAEARAARRSKLQSH